MTLQSSSEEDEWVEKTSSDAPPSEKKVKSASDGSLPQVYVTYIHQVYALQYNNRQSK
jgi:hypothetical protein